MDCKEIYEKWKDDPNKLNLELNYLSHDFLRDAPQFFEDMINEIESRSDNQPDEVFADLLSIIGFCNFLVTKNPDILDRLINFISKIKDALEKIAEMKLADSYNVSAGVPFGISVGLTWNTKKG